MNSNPMLLLILGFLSILVGLLDIGMEIHSFYPSIYGLKWKPGAFFLGCSFLFSGLFFLFYALFTEKEPKQSFVLGLAHSLFGIFRFLALAGAYYYFLKFQYSPF